MVNGNYLEKLFLETKQMRRSISKLKNFLTAGILLLVIVFLLLMWNLFGSYDKEKLADAFRSEMSVVTPVLSESAVEIAREVLPVYQEAFADEFQTLLPELREDVRKEGLLFVNYVSENAPQLIQTEMESVLGRVRAKILREFPELAEDEDKIVAALTNIVAGMQEEAEELVKTGIFAHHVDILMEIYETVHEDFKMRRSNEMPDELSNRLFSLLGRIIEYEFFVDRVENEEVTVTEMPVRKQEPKEVGKVPEGRGKKPSRFKRSKR